MLEIKNLNIKIQNTIIVENLSFTLNEGDKLAIIGEEGNGKSTILKAILNDAYYATVTGIINYKNSKIGYLKQNLEENELEKDGFIEAVATKGYFVKNKSEDFKKEEILKRVEASLNETIKIANTYNIKKEEVLNMLNILYEEENNEKYN